LQQLVAPAAVTAPTAINGATLEPNLTPEAAQQPEPVAAYEDEQVLEGVEIGTMR